MSKLRAFCLFLLACSGLIWLAGCHTPSGKRQPAAGFVLAIHGGAGGVSRDKLAPEYEAARRAVLRESLRAGEAVLQTNGAALDAVIAAIRVLEDSPLFNAGRGAVLNWEGFAELDASLMDGATRKAGAVAAVQRVKNPILAARAVMDQTPHVLLAGEAADQFAASQQLEMAPREYFITEPRRQQWESLRRKETQKKPQARENTSWEGRAAGFGTVGAVALDRHGNLAAGTSTGGLAGKRQGRVGDSPIIGAGTYADNATCAVSGTGQGEFFIRSVAAHDIAALMEYRKMTVAAAADLVVKKKLVNLGAEGGVIALDRQGRVAMPFNTAVMNRGFIREGGEPFIAIHP